MPSLIRPDDIISSISISPNTKTIWVGFSGGLDSHVLLYLLSQYQTRLKPKIVAIHINHGLNNQADSWVKHCKKVCNDLEIEFRAESVEATAPKGESQEAWARNVRYEKINQFMVNEDILLTAHHSDDMAETLLLQLLRGAGPPGLASMPLNIRFGEGWHCRPLLFYTRSQLKEFADYNELSWVEDNSNLDPKYDRNYLRHNVIPIIKERWPAMAKTLTRAAVLQAETSLLLENLARIDLVNCMTNNTNNLNIKGLNLLSTERVKNVIRYWIKSEGYTTPTAVQLHKIISDVINAKASSEPCVSWQGTQIRRYRDILFLTPPLPDNSSKQERICWQLVNDCTLLMGNLTASHGKGNGIKAEKCRNKDIIVKFRCGSETIKKGAHHRKLRTLFQEAGIPSCFRDFIPLIYIDEKLVAVSGLHVDDDFAATNCEDAIQIHWSAAESVFGLFE